MGEFGGGTVAANQQVAVVRHRVGNSMTAQSQNRRPFAARPAESFCQARFGIFSPWHRRHDPSDLWFVGCHDGLTLLSLYDWLRIRPS
ncbi:hypothetical protein [Streptomyces cellulosae]|uniref:Transposase n=1 Tax=Streptomyces cellulosae TaxID=1968 RepID=A0ABW7Y2Z4_STRCE